MSQLVNQEGATETPNERRAPAYARADQKSRRRRLRPARRERENALRTNDGDTSL